MTNSFIEGLLKVPEHISDFRLVNRLFPATIITTTTTSFPSSSTSSRYHHSLSLWNWRETGRGKEREKRKAQDVIWLFPRLRITISYILLRSSCFVVVYPKGG